MREKLGFCMREIGRENREIREKEEGCWRDYGVYKY